MGVIFTSSARKFSIDSHAAKGRNNAAADHPVRLQDVPGKNGIFFSGNHGISKIIIVKDSLPAGWTKNDIDSLLPANRQINFILHTLEITERNRWVRPSIETQRRYPGRALELPEYGLVNGHIFKRTCSPIGKEPPF